MMIEDISILLQILLMLTDTGLELMEVKEGPLFYWEPIIEEGDSLPKIVDQRT